MPDCSRCNDTNMVVTDKGELGIVSEPCPNCGWKVGIWDCAKGHSRVTFRSTNRDACPMCALLIRMAWLEAELKRLRGLQRSTAQTVNDRAKEKNALPESS